MNRFSNVLADAYRCPDDICKFTVQEEPDGKPGFFRFGKDVFGYGRTCGTVTGSPSQESADVLGSVQTDSGNCVIPFDPNEVVNNLRFERYVENSNGLLSELIYRGYYAVRPLLPVPVRRHLQRARLRTARDKIFPQWPVDCTVDRILETTLALSLKARGLQSTPFVSFWPKGVPSCAIMTHDVETDEGLRFCPTLMDIDDSFGIKSSFQLVPEQRYAVTDSTLRSIRDRGFEANVHDFNHDGHLYSNREQFQDRARKINEYARKFGADGFRSGAMYRKLDWYGSFEFDYDMSVPTVGHLEAQGGGCCTLRPYFINRIIELPLTTTQDYSLFHILGQYSIDLWKQQIDQIIERRGLLSFIVHPDYIIEHKAQAVYKALLAHLAQLRDKGKISVCLPGEVAKWWRQRSVMQLRHSKGRWEITGAGAENARISIASVHDDSAILHD